jgi:hypothetical protein
MRPPSSEDEEPSYHAVFLKGNGDEAWEISNEEMRT